MEKTLKSGKKVEVKEISALEDILAYQFAGKVYDEKNVVGTATMIRSVQASLSVTKVDDLDVPRPTNLDEAYAIIGRFSKREWAEVLNLFSELNELDEENPEKMGE